MQFDTNAPVPSFLGGAGIKEAAMPNWGQIGTGASNAWGKVKGFFTGAKTPPVLPKAPTPKPVATGAPATPPGFWGKTWNTTKNVGSGAFNTMQNVGMAAYGIDTVRNMFGGQPGAQMGPTEAIQAQQAMANGHMTGLPSDYYTGFLGGQNPGAQTNFMHEIMARGNAARMQQQPTQPARTVYIDTAAPMMSQAHASAPSFFG